MDVTEAAAIAASQTATQQAATVSASQKSAHQAAEAATSQAAATATLQAPDVQDTEEDMDADEVAQLLAKGASEDEAGADDSDEETTDSTKDKKDKEDEAKKFYGQS